MRACSKRAYQYMLLYKAVETLNLDANDGTVDKAVLNKHSILKDLMKLYRKLKKCKKCQRSVMDNQIQDACKNVGLGVSVRCGE